MCDPSPGTTPGPKLSNLHTWQVLVQPDSRCQSNPASLHTTPHTEYPQALTNALLKAKFTYLSEQSVKNLHTLKLQSCENICAHASDQKSRSIHTYVLMSDCRDCFSFNTVFAIVTLF